MLPPHDDNPIVKMLLALLLAQPQFKNGYGFSQPAPTAGPQGRGTYGPQFAEGPVGQNATLGWAQPGRPYPPLSPLFPPRWTDLLQSRPKLFF